jgi:ribonuclease E
VPLDVEDEDEDVEDEDEDVEDEDAEDDEEDDEDDEDDEVALDEPSPPDPPTRSCGAGPGHPAKAAEKPATSAPPIPIPSGRAPRRREPFDLWNI